MRPRIKLKLGLYDWLLEFLAVIGIALLLFQPISYQLSFKNELDFSEMSVWYTSLFGISVYVLFLILNRFPFFRNYIVEINEENAKEQYTLSVKWLRLMNVIIVYLNNFMAFDKIQSMRGFPDFPGVTMVLCVGSVLSITLLGSIVYYIKSLCRLANSHTPNTT